MCAVPRLSTEVVTGMRELQHIAVCCQISDRDTYLAHKVAVWEAFEVQSALVVLDYIEVDLLAWRAATALAI